MRAVLLLITILSGAWAQGTMSPVERKLQHELLAPCCYRETIAHHMSGESYAMRDEVHRMVESGQTERQIVDHYKAQYGMRILAEPEGLAWWIDTIIPVSFFVGGVIAVLFLISKWRRGSLTVSRSSSSLL